MKGRFPALVPCKGPRGTEGCRVRPPTLVVPGHVCRDCKKAMLGASSGAAPRKRRAG